MSQIVFNASKFIRGEVTPSYATTFGLVKMIWEEGIQTYKQLEGMLGFEEMFAIFKKYFSHYKIGDKYTPLRAIIMLQVLQVQVDSWTRDMPLIKWVRDMFVEGINTDIRLCEVKYFAKCKIWVAETNQRLARKMIVDGFNEMKKISQAKKRLELAPITDEEKKYELKNLDLCFKVEAALYNIAKDFEKGDRNPNSLERYNEILQEHFEHDISVKMGDIEAKSENIKAFYNDAKRIWEATPIKEKEVIVWDGGDIWENIVLKKGVF